MLAISPLILGFCYQAVRTVLKHYLMMVIKGLFFLLLFNRNIFFSKLLHERSWKKNNMTSHFVTINHLLCKLRCLQDFVVQGLPAHGACTNNEGFTTWVISTFRKRSFTNESIKGYRQRKKKEQMLITKGKQRE